MKSAVELIVEFGEPGVTLAFLRKHSGESNEDLRSCLGEAWRKGLIRRQAHSDKHVYYWLPKDDDIMSALGVRESSSINKLVPDTPVVNPISRVASVMEMRRLGIPVSATIEPVRKGKYTKVGFVPYDDYVGFIQENLDNRDIEPAIHSKLAAIREATQVKTTQPNLQQVPNNHPWRLPLGETHKTVRITANFPPNSLDKLHVKEHTAEISELDVEYEEKLLGLTPEDKHGNKN